MTGENTDWAKVVTRVEARIAQHPQAETRQRYSEIVDDIVGALDAHGLVVKYGTRDAVASALSYVTMGLYGGGSCPPIDQGGWYERDGNFYRVAPGFAQNWAELRGLPSPVVKETVYWFVGALFKTRGEDQVERFLSEGIWENGYPDRHLDEVRSMKPGDRIAIKATYVRKHGLPFDTKGRSVSVMSIKATGTIIANPGDGRRVQVSWTREPTGREWYFYTYRKTVWRVVEKGWMSRGLIDFAFNGEPQDIPHFLQEWGLDRAGSAGEDRFAWVGFYEDFAQALRRWRDRRAELVAHVHAVAQEVAYEGIGHLTDRFADGSERPLEDICPFTVMTLFNRKLKEENRTRIAAKLAVRLGVDVPAPTSFDGLPVFMPLKSWFFLFASDRADGDIDRLWDVFEAALAEAEASEESPDADARFIAAYDAVSHQKGINANLSIGLYYASPQRFVSLDGPMRSQLKALGVEIAADKSGRLTGRDYLALCDLLEARLLEGSLPVSSLPALSYRAYLEKAKEKSPEEAVTVVVEPEEPEAEHVALPAYGIDAVLTEGCFVSGERLETMLGALREMKNIVLQGPPGTGKTWLAKRLGYALVGAKDVEAVEVVQFHPTMSYEDFVRGWRPAGDGRLGLVDGVLLQAAARARATEGPVVLVIEEINRGNPAQAFGEMLTLVEATMRNAPMRLAYMRESEPLFSLPDNLHLIGTMNVADRSLALVDLAFRRRFAFFDLEPCLNRAWRAHCATRGMPDAIADALAERLAALNEVITAERALGPNFRIGHSYVTPSDKQPADWRAWFRLRVETQIKPLLQEYWFDAPEKASSEVERLLADLPS